KRLSHVLDPRTGRPAEGVWSATVLAPTAAQADALGTACFVLGLDGCQRLLEHCPDLGILLVLPNRGRHQTVVLGDMDSVWYAKEN
ncbi:MAG: FAD:protein FMN transferase, partial [Planctomycetaceae bacterium]|nr:FAD:protein FMN transferase [Planctomycetaceae bacterium]